MKKQQGAGAVFMLVLLALAFSGFFTLLRLMPLYSNDMAIETVFENISNEKQESLTRKRVYDMIEKRFSINGLTDLMEYVEVNGQGSVILVEMEYERRVPLVSNIELVATFKHNIELSE